MTLRKKWHLVGNASPSPPFAKSLKLSPVLWHEKIDRGRLQKNHYHDLPLPMENRFLDLPLP